MDASALAVAGAAGAAAAALLRPVGCFDALVRLALGLRGVRSRSVRVAGIPLHWLERTGREPAVVLLHGLGASAERWFPVLPSLLRGRRLLVPSLPAHGRSGSPTSPFGVADLARWMGEWLEAAGVDSPADLVGFSMGGWVAALMALEEPRRLRRLVLAASAGVSFEPPPPRELLAPASLGEARRLLSVLSARPLRLPGFVLRDLLRRVRPERRWLVDSLLRGEALLDERLHDMAVPTLVVWGEEDRLLPVASGRRLAARIPGARWAEIPACGHLLYWERRARFQSLLEEFLA